MNIKYSLFDPNGNITALVETAVDPSQYPFVAKELMKREPSCEQVGFVKDHDLCMAGGEFCGNASLCAAARLALADCKIGETNDYALTVSGADQTVFVHTRKETEDFVKATVTMPLAISVQNIIHENVPMTLVGFRGITHAVTEQSLSPSFAEILVKKLCADQKADAFGLILFNADDMTIQPLVYVPTSDTLFWESSCASGTAAVGVLLAQKCGYLVNTLIRQPKGILGIQVGNDGRLLLSGTSKRIKTDGMTLDF